jgi:hypothetical protein
MLREAELKKETYEKLYKELGKVTNVDTEHWHFKERGFLFRFDVLIVDLVLRDFDVLKPLCIDRDYITNELKLDVGDWNTEPKKAYKKEPQVVVGAVFD